MQAKLPVNAPGDRYEVEADRVADQIAEPTATVQPITSHSQPGESGAGAAAPAIVDEVLRSPGRGLDQFTRDALEPRFGRDFGDVRIHTDAQASASAGAIGADAYTAGSNVVFASGRFAPETTAGLRLLAHELTHTVQQNDGRAGIQRTGGAEPVPMGQEITAAQLSAALTGPTFEDRLAAIIALFRIGDFMTSATLLTLANFAPTPPSNESEDRAAVRHLLGAVVKVERVQAGFKIVLSQSEVEVKVKGFKIRLKNGAIAAITVSKSNDLQINADGVSIQAGVFISIPVITISDDQGSILGLLSLSLVKK